MRENQKRVNVYIPIDLYVLCTRSDKSLTEAIIQGLELVLAPEEPKTNTSVNQEILELQEIRIEELQGQIKVKDNQQEIRVRELQEQIKIKDNQQEIRVRELQEQIKVKDNQQEIRVRELQEQIKVKDNQQEIRVRELQEQIKVKDEQLKAKDNQLEKLTETMKAQAIHIQTLLNQKAIEAPGAKRPWWKFW